MNITPEQFQQLIDALKSIASGLTAIAGAIGSVSFVAWLFLLFKKMG